tara:strand:+ start:91747 stop:93810 length:2064 start_codon:yes stop_codon:yes gene_type:complete
VTLRARGLAVGIASAVLVLVLTMAAADRQSPGPISSVHAGLTELGGGESCAACHGGWFGNMQTSCYECHEEIDKQIQDGHGLHGSLADGQAAACATCHSEHHGGEFQLVNRLAFAQAGVPDPGQFDHKIIGLDLSGAHVGLECTACHEHAEAKVLADGQQRYLGLSRDCATCHSNPHGGQMQVSCVTCHSQETFRERFVANHDRWLPLEGTHGGLDCRSCHEMGSDNALEQLRPISNRVGRGCAACHESPHTQGFVVGNAQSDGVSPESGCVTCHTLDHENFDDPGLVITAKHHRHAGFTLDEPHQAVACTQCHVGDGTFAQRHPGRGPDDCRSCHADPHGGQFDDSPLAAQDCVSCHTRTQFVPHAFDVAMHAQTALPLTGQHAQQDCVACHKVVDDDDVRRFGGTPVRCEDCHENAHGDAFLESQVVLDAEPRGECATCHQTQAWSQLDHAKFDHKDWTGFVVDGAHSQIECTDCHARTEQPDRFGRRFGRIPEHQAGQAECFRCHGDPHEGIFDRDGVPKVVAGRSGCVRCHDTASFRALPHGFDHAAFAGFELTGKHGTLACTACHEALSETTSTGRTWGKARGQTCSDCHTDPHQGQFARVGRTDCRRCHKSANTFATLSFRHNLDSRFQLGEQHRKVACNLCHKSETKDGATIVRYKPLPTKCVDCHGREEGGTSRRRRRR